MNHESIENAVTVVPPVARGLRPRDAAEYVGFSEAFLKKARCGLTEVPGPRFKKIGTRVVYLREDLDAFLDQAEDVLDSRLSKESRINQMKDKRIELLEAVLVAIVNFDIDQDCLPGCDSIAHEDLCPYCNPEMVMIDMAKKTIAAEDKDDAG